jgi:type III polyketide synthase
MATANGFGDLELSIIGVGSQYPPYNLDSDAIDILSKRFYPESTSYVMRLTFSVGGKL